MTYTVISHALVSGKTFGDSLTEEELLTEGVNIDALIAAGHIEEVPPTPSSASEGTK